MPGFHVDASSNPGGPASRPAPCLWPGRAVEDNLLPQTQRFPQATCFHSFHLVSASFLIYSVVCYIPSNPGPASVIMVPTSNYSHFAAQDNTLENLLLMSVFIFLNVLFNFLIFFTHNE